MKKLKCVKMVLLFSYFTNYLCLHGHYCYPLLLNALILPVLFHVGQLDLLSSRALGDDVGDI